MPLFGHDPLANPEPLIRRVYAYVAYRVGGGADAEDLTSEVFERALRYRDRYDSQRGNEIAWLLGIARRCVAGALATRAEFPVEVHELEAAENVEEDTIRRLTVADAVATLDEHDRELLALRYGADLSTRRIAALLSMRTNAVDVALHRARARLRAALDLETPPEPRTLEPSRRARYSDL